MKPNIALVMGDPAGVGPELMAKLLRSPGITGAQVVCIGDARLFEKGARDAGTTLALEALGDGGELRLGERPILIDTRNLDPAGHETGKVSEEGGRSAIANYARALDMARDGTVDAITFVPFNKQAIRLSEPAYEDELVYAVARMGFSGGCAEFNVIDEFWNARVTSHVPIREVADLITPERIIERLQLTHRALVEGGVEKPRIGVAALNPHAGDGGAFGREDIDVIEPAVATAREQGVNAEGPYPSDTVFWRARRGQFDAVLTMYHDQGQIAIKLLGFEHGVTVLGGLPVPITTPAHGTAYDIAGQGIANPEPTLRAFELARTMAVRRRERAAA